MKKAIVSLYIAAVIAISLIAQASRAAVSEVELRGALVALSADGTELLVTGRYPNPCTQHADVQLVPAHSDILNLVIIAEKTNDLCIALVGDEFRMVLPLAALKEKLPQGSVDPNGTYRVITADGRFNEVINFNVSGESATKMDLSMLLQVRTAPREVSNF